MPLFYFHLRHEDGICRDDLGVDFPSLEAAYMDAFRAAQALWAEMLRKRRNPIGHKFEIADDRGRVVMELPFSEVLEACGGDLRARRRPVYAEARRRTTRTLALADALREEIELSRAAVIRSRELLAALGK